MSFWFIRFCKHEPTHGEANSHINCYSFPHQYWSIQDRDIIQPESSGNSACKINTAKHIWTSGLVKLINFCVYKLKKIKLVAWKPVRKWTCWAAVHKSFLWICRQYTKLLSKFLWHSIHNLLKLALINDISDICLPLAGSGGWCSSLQEFYQLGSYISFVFMFCHL